MTFWQTVDHRLRLLFWLMCAGTIVLALLPSSNSPGLFALADKAAHAVAFLVLTAIGLRAYPRHTMILLLLLVGLGGAIEVAQGYTSTRSQEWEDFIADLIGIALALVVRRFIALKA